MSTSGESDWNDEMLRKYERIIAPAPDHISILNRDYVYQVVNETYLKAHGKSRDEIIGHTVSELLGPELFGVLKEYLDRCLKGEVVNFLKWIDFAAIGKRFMSVIYYPFFDGQGTVIGAVVTSRDLTELKTVEEKLEESEKKYRLLFEHLNDAAFLADAGTGRLFETNKQGEVLLGRERDEILGMHQSELHHPGKSEEYRKRFTAHVEKGSTANDMGEVLMKDGTAVPVHISSATFELGGKKLILGLFRDMTEYMKAQEALRLMGEQFRVALKHSPIAVFNQDTELRYTWVYNPHPGLSTEEMLGKTDRDLLSPGDAERLTRIKSAVLKTGLAAREEVKVSYNNGPDIYYDLTIEPLYDAKGEIGGITCAAMDITRHKRIEDDLRKSEARLSAAQQIARIGNWDLDLSTDEMEWSDEIYRIFCMEPGKASLTYEGFLSLIHADDRENFKNSVKTALSSNLPVTTEFKTTCPKCEHICSSKIEPKLDDSGRPSRVIGTVQDITENKKLERELLKSQKLESIGVLAGGIAHDFNNLLTGIYGNISLAGKYLSPDNKARQILLRAEAASIRARDLTRQLLTFSKGGAPVKQTVSLAERMRDWCSLALLGSNAQCHFDIHEALWPVDIDEGQISQAIHNLILNASQSMPGGGTIGIRGDNVVLSKKEGLPLKEGSYVRISIEDKGAGIPDEHLEKIFDPYFTTKQKGTGLGLATTYSIIKNHEGYITVESQVGSGSAFYVYLPASRKEAVRNEKVKEAPVFGKGKVLVMDDEELIRDLTGDVLPYLGYSVELAKEGSEAIGLYISAMKSEEPFDAVILDLTIPGGMGGREALEKLLEINPNVKALVSSGYSNDPIMADYKKYGIKGVVAKPFNIETLSKALYNVINGA
ncbi:MAG: PAS domain S-box protein [Deltaproteobacteria bacterium]|nr:PAS domain S-box protein [Deltaproteobacteria bacterium]